MRKKGIPKRDGSGRGVRANRGRGGCRTTRKNGRRMNRLNFKTKKQAVLAIALLRSPFFRKSRLRTKISKKLYNQEIRLAKRSVKKFGINLRKPLPKERKI